MEAAAIRLMEPASRLLADGRKWYEKSDEIH